MRLKATGDVIFIRSQQALKSVLSQFYKCKQEYIVLGMGANTLLKEESDFPYIKLDFPFDKSYLQQVHISYTLPASLKLSVLSSHAIKFGLSGWEVFTGIPATLGGAVFMNAGTSLGEIGSIVKSVQLITKTGVLKNIICDKDSFSYRCNHFLEKGDIIFSVELKHLGVDDKITQKITDYLEFRNKHQPLKEFTCGCVFENYQNKKGMIYTAGKYIDLVGLKGLTLNGLKISNKHANFMENLEQASYGQVVQLIDIIKEELILQYGINFETEVKFEKENHLYNKS